jgi:anthranilate/para-aminobenzoate synthase component II
MHGKTSTIHHDGAGVFRNVSQPFAAGRYHSLVVAQPLPPDLELAAHTEDGTVMGVRHRSYPIHGVQFHPESVLTNEGRTLLRNFLEM